MDKKRTLRVNVFIYMQQCLGMMLDSMLPEVTLKALTLWDMVESIFWTSAVTKDVFRPRRYMWQINVWYNTYLFTLNFVRGQNILFKKFILYNIDIAIVYI